MEPTSIQNTDQAFYMDAKEHTRALWEALHSLLAMQTRWNALDSGNTMGAGEGSNLGLVAADVGAVVFASADAIKGLLDGGHATNMAKLL
jgi:hypothetical protein